MKPMGGRRHGWLAGVPTERADEPTRRPRGPRELTYFLPARTVAGAGSGAGAGPLVIDAGDWLVPIFLSD